MNHLIRLLDNDLCANLVMALLHSLWQALAIAGLLLLFLRSKAAKDPNVRYAAALIALTAILLCGLFTWSVLEYEPAALAETPSVVLLGKEAVSTPEQVPTGVEHTYVRAQTPGPPDASDSPSHTNWRVWVICAWLLGVAIMLLRAIYTAVGGAGLRRQCRPLEDEHILALVEQLRQSVGIARRIRVAASQHISVPGVVGCIWPTLLLPVSMISGVPRDDLRAVLAHELAHVRRYDYLVNFSQMLIEAIFFFNPAVWWVSKQIRFEREVCCDEAGVAATGQRIRYAEVLAEWAQRLRDTNANVAAPAIAFGRADDSGGMLERIRRIVLVGHRPRLRVSWHIATLTLVLSLGVLAGLWRGTTMTVALAARLPAGQSRTFHFPKDHSIGELYIRDRDFPNAAGSSIGWEGVGYAQGDVTVPPGKALRLNISKAAWQEGKLFAGLKPDDIQMLSFTRYPEADDSVLEDISTLTGLQMLALGGTQIRGTGLHHIGELKELQSLDLSVTQVDAQALASLAGLNSLETLGLNLASVGNAGMVHVGKIKTLKSLVISGASVDDNGLAHLKDLVSLQRLRAWDNHITDEGLKHLAGLTELEDLGLVSTRISGKGLAQLGKLKKLKNLRLGDTDVGDEGLEHLGKLKSLEYLELPSTTNVSDAGLAQLSELNSLKKLYVISDSITAQGLESLAKLASLEELDTGGRNLDDASMARVAGFPSLKALWIQHCPVTDAGLAELKNLKSLTTLEMGRIPITGEGLAVLREFPALVKLELSSLSLGDAGLSGLAGLSSLESLMTSYFRVDDEDLAYLSGMANLKTLSIDSGAISDAGMQHLENLKSLEDLWLHSSEITDAGLVHLRGHSSLRHLGLPNSKVTEEAMVTFKQKIPALRYYLPERPPAPKVLTGRQLPRLKDFDIQSFGRSEKGMMTLVCFWDTRQRAARRCVLELAGQVDDLEKKGVVTVLIHASPDDAGAAKAWTTKFKIPFPCGTIAGDAKEVEATRRKWCVQGLPWLILTDEEHIVKAEGFRIGKLDAKISALRKR